MIILNDICQLIVDCEHKTAPTSTSGYPSIRTPNIGRGRLILNSVNRVTPETYKIWTRRAVPKPYDLIVAREAPLGNVAMILRGQEVCLGQRTVLVRPDPEKVSPAFLCYFLLGDYAQARFHATATGAIVPHLNMKDIRGLPIPELPPLKIQQRIASILSAYDDLIGNNRRRIAILEEMARRLYEEWFIKFRFPGHENIQFGESLIGRMPANWLQPFPDYVDFLEGPGLRKWQYRKKGFPFLNIRTFAKNDIDTSKCQFIDPEEAESRYSRFFLSEYDHVVSSSGTLGKIATVQKIHLPLMSNTSIIRMRSKKSRIKKWQILEFLKSRYFQNQINSFAVGSAQKNYGPSHLKKMWIVAPDEKISDAFEDAVAPLHDKILLEIRRNRNLQTQRDLLLPKLVSGAIDISRIDASAAESAAT